MQSSAFNGSGGGGGKDNRPNGGPKKLKDDDSGGTRRRGRMKRTPSQTSIDTESTVATGITTQQQQQSSVVQAAPQQQQLQSTLAAQQQFIQNLAVIFGALSGSSFGVFLLLYLPFAAFLALMVFASSTLFTTYLLYIWMGLGYQRLLQGRGLGDYLPQSIYDQLGNITLHEWMQDSTFTTEYRHLLLYFVPGVTQEQLEEYVNRLPARRQDNLRRIGLGHFFGEGFMRLMMGQERYRQHMLQQPAPVATLPPTLTSRQLDLVLEDGEEGGGLDISPDGRDEVPTMVGRSLDFSLPPELATSGGTSQGRSIEVTTSSSPENRQRENDEEGNILTEAFIAMSTSYTASTVSTVTSTVVETISPLIIGSGLGLTSLSAGLGLYGIWTGAYAGRHGAPSSRGMPSMNILAATGLFGGFSAGVMFGVRYTVRAMIRASREDSRKNKTDLIEFLASDEDDEMKKKKE